MSFTVRSPWCTSTSAVYNNYTLCFDNNVHYSSLLIANCSCGPDCKCTGQCERGCCSCICNDCDGSPCQCGESCKCDMKECCETVKCTTCSKFVSIIVDLINFTQCLPSPLAPQRTVFVDQSVKVLVTAREGAVSVFVMDVLGRTVHVELTAVALRTAVHHVRRLRRVAKIAVSH